MHDIRRTARDFMFNLGGYLALPITVACHVIGFLFLLAEAFLIMLFRGTSYVRWLPPSKCGSFSAWISAEWQYYGRGGIQRGTRKFGLEVARRGHISNHHPLV